MHKTRLLSVEEGFTLRPILPYSRLHWKKLAQIYASCMASIPILLVGFWLAKNFSLLEIILITLISILIVFVLDSANSALGADTGLPAAVLASNCLGKSFSKIVVAAPLILAGWGWFGIQLALAIDSLLVALGAEGLLTGPNGTLFLLLLGLSIGALFAFTPISRRLARSGLTNLSILFMSLFCIIILIVGIINLRSSGWNSFIDQVFPGNFKMPLSLGSAVIVGLCASQFVMISDYSRFCRRIFPDSVFVPLFGVTPIQAAFCMISAIVTLMTQFNPNFFSNLIQAGVPRLSFLLLFFSQWNAARLVVIYSAGLAGASLIENPSQRARKWITILSVLGGTLLVGFGIKDFFVHFLVLQSMFFSPLGVLLFLDHFIVRKRNLTVSSRTNKKALFSLVMGWSSCVLIFIYLPRCYAFLGSAFIAAAIYLFLNRNYLSSRGKSLECPALREKPKKNLQVILLLTSLLGLLGGTIFPITFTPPFGDLMVLFSSMLLAIVTIIYLSQTIGLAIEDAKLRSDHTTLDGQRN
jgi:cytosine permease